MGTDPNRYGLTREFAATLGLFYVNWAKIELMVDFSIHTFLNITSEQTHLITSAIDFGRRAQWLRGLIIGSSVRDKSTMLEALNAIQNDSKRNVFAHSYLSTDRDSVEFVERIPFGKFSIRSHSFKREEFMKHVDTIADHAIAFQAALGISEQDLDDFAQAAINMAAKVTVSREPSRDGAE